jgi:Ser/Thr protein kinase RdoA (MazF antagonist)
LGLILARLHSLPAGGNLAASENTPANIFAEIKPFLEGIKDLQQKPYAQEMLETIAAFSDFSGLPVALIHTDPYFVNLLEDSQGGLYLIDWDDTGVSYALLDVGYVIAHLCTFTPREQEQWQINPRARIAWQAGWAKLFLDAYQSIRPLTGEEKAFLPHAALFNMIEYVQDWDNHTLIEDNCLRYRILKDQVKLLLG